MLHGVGKLQQEPANSLVMHARGVKKISANALYLW